MARMEEKIVKYFYNAASQLMLPHETVYDERFGIPVVGQWRELGGTRHWNNYWDVFCFDVYDAIWLVHP